MKPSKEVKDYLTHYELQIREGRKWTFIYKTFNEEECLNELKQVSKKESGISFRVVEKTPVDIEIEYTDKTIKTSKS